MDMTEELEKLEFQYDKLWEYTKGLQKKIAELTLERNAAVAEIEHSCKTCKIKDVCDDADCIADRADNWEWEGVNHDKRATFN